MYIYFFKDIEARNKKLALVSVAQTLSFYFSFKELFYGGPGEANY